MSVVEVVATLSETPTLYCRSRLFDFFLDYITSHGKGCELSKQFLLKQIEAI